MNSTYYISKTKYCRGGQCSKNLWMEENMSEKVSGIAPGAILANGQIVGEIVRDYFGKYDLVEFLYDKELMCQRTAELMESGF